MNNLGWYQWITTNSKKVGGPLNFLALIELSGIVVGGLIANKYRDFKDKRKRENLRTYSVTEHAEIKKIKLILEPGDRITVLAADDDSILLAKNDDENNPYFVPVDFLVGCTNYIRVEEKN